MNESEIHRPTAEAQEQAICSQFRESIASIFAVTYLLSTDDDGKGDVYAYKIREGCYDMLRHITNMEMCSRAGYATIKRESIDIVSLVGSIVDAAASICETPITCTLVATEATVCADEELLTHTILCVLRNAIQYTHNRNSVSITLSEVGRRVIMTVVDHGHGIMPEHLPHIFEPYYSIPAYGDDAPQPGLGIGLALARRALVAMGGSIIVKSTFGAGTTVAISLPKATHPESEPRSYTSADFLMNRYSPLYIQLAGLCRLPY